MLTREKIKLLRHSRKWSQEYIAEKLGMSPNGYGALERGDSSITLEKLEKFAQLLEVPLSELCDDGGNNVFNLAGANNHNTTQFQINVYSPECSELNNHQLKLVGLSCGLKVRIRVDFTTRLSNPQSCVL